jgi:hypothetical protein
VALRSPSGWYSWFVKVQSAQEGVVSESAESSSRPAVVTIGVERSGFSVEPKQRFITEPKRRGLKTAVGCRQAELSYARVRHGSRASLQRRSMRNFASQSGQDGDQRKDVVHDGYSYRDRVSGSVQRRAVCAMLQ